MTAEVFFENIHTKSRFKVVSFNKEKGTVTLIGRHGLEFEQRYSKEHFEEMGYRPVKEEAAPPPPSAEAAPPPPVAQPA